MTQNEALALAATLTARLKEKHGVDVEFKVTHPYLSQKKTDYSVSTVKMVTKKNLISGLPFEIDEDTPPWLDPSTETYHSM